jgi:hypothetical protein
MTRGWDDTLGAPKSHRNASSAVSDLRKGFQRVHLRNIPAFHRFSRRAYYSARSFFSYLSYTHHEHEHLPRLYLDNPLQPVFCIIGLLFLR